MKSSVAFALTAVLITSLSCGLFSKAIHQVSQQESPDDNKCSLDKWKLLINSVQQKENGDGTKDVIVSVGIQNNDHLWGSLDGPYTVNNPKPVTMTTTSGKVYEPTSKNILLTLDNGDITAYGSGFIKTLLLPPGFTASGQSISGIPTTYSFIFNIANNEIPATFSIDTLEINCIGDPYYIMVNGAPVYGGGIMYVPLMTYNISGDFPNINEEPLANNYPELKGSRLVRENNAGEFEFTGVTRHGNSITITFNFTNHASYPSGPSFGGYIIGDQNVFTCLEAYESDCDLSHSAVAEAQPEQTIKDVTWTFVVPKDERNLLFVYIPAENAGDNSSKVYNLGP